MRSATIGTDTLGEPAISACIHEVARGWRFPSPEGGGLTLVTSRYVFESAVHHN